MLVIKRCEVIKVQRDAGLREDRIQRVGEVLIDVLAQQLNWLPWDEYDVVVSQPNVIRRLWTFAVQSTRQV